MRSDLKAFIPLLKRLLFCSFITSACATKTITFAVAGTGKVSTVSPDNLDKEAQFLGETPLTIEVSKVQGKIIKISQKGKIPVYWVLPDVAGQNIRANLTLVDEPKSAADVATNDAKDGKKDKGADKLVDAKATTNRIMRLLLKAYQALGARRLQLAQELAGRASAIDPEIAAPLVIKGIALMQAGDKSGARAALSNARALDPEDSDIETLLKALR